MLAKLLNCLSQTLVSCSLSELQVIVNVPFVCLFPCEAQSNH